MKNQQQMMKQLQQVQARMAKMQEELNDVTVTGTAGGGVVSVTADGHQKLLAVTIEPEALEEGAELLVRSDPGRLQRRARQVARGSGGEHVAAHRGVGSSSRAALTGIRCA